jgi:ubiquinone biosynthesis protein
MQIPRVRVISRTYRHLQRYRQILGILVKYGFADLIQQIQLPQILQRGLRLFSHGLWEERMSRPERLRRAFEEMGPTFIKLAQILSTRPDLIPLSYAQELAKLQDQVPPFPFSQVEEILAQELKAPLREHFSQFQETPLAAASIGQVHRARLRSGKEVAVKVQRPRIREMISVDLEILMHLATLIERHVGDFGIQRPTAIVEEFGRILGRELDYTIEAAHLERFAWQFQGNPSIYVPQVYREVSTEKIFTMDFVSGIKVSELAELERRGWDRKVLAERGSNLILEQIFLHGFFHGDPHPGNIFILPDHVICFLDFGMMGTVSQSQRADFAELVLGYAQRDEGKILRALLKIVEWEEEPNRRRLERDVAEFVGIYLYRPLKELRIETMVKRLLELIHRHRLRIPSDIFLMMKALGTAEGVGSMLDPDFQLAEKMTPFLRRLQMDRLRPASILQGVWESGGEFLMLLKEIPGDIRDFLRQMKQGRIHVSFDHPEFEELSRRIHHSSNRIALALITASLFIGSGLMLQTQVGPTLGEIPLLGLAMLFLATVFGVGVLILTLRSQRR